MMTDAAIADDACPRLPRGVRLRYDEARESWLLLAPERVIACSVTAAEILKRCTGAAPVAAIVDDLASAFKADRAVIDRDVRRLLGDLVTKRLVDL
jgi:pyrroloquinoline quinone biosynthesis protein D